MKIIKAYWESKEFDMVKHWETVKHFVTYEVPDNTTEEEIDDLMRRKDVIRINEP